MMKISTNLFLIVVLVLGTSTIQRVTGYCTSIQDFSKCIDSNVPGMPGWTCVWCNSTNGCLMYNSCNNNTYIDSDRFLKDVQCDNLTINNNIGSCGEIKKSNLLDSTGLIISMTLIIVLVSGVLICFTLSCTTINRCLISISGITYIVLVIVIAILYTVYAEKAVKENNMYGHDYRVAIGLSITFYTLLVIPIINAMMLMVYGMTLLPCCINLRNKIMRSHYEQLTSFEQEEGQYEINSINAL